MRVLQPTGIPDSPDKPKYLTQDKFDRGVISLIDESKIPRNALKEAVNIKLAEDGAPMLQDGIAWYGAAPSSDAIDGAEMYLASDGSTHLLVVAGGTVYRSTDDGATWDTCTGATLTSGERVGFVQGLSYMFIHTKENYIVRYDGSTTLVVYTGLSKPVGNTPTETGLTGSTYTYYYRVSAVNDAGYTVASVAKSITVSHTRSSWSETKYVTFTWTKVTGAKRYEIFVGQTLGEEAYIDSVIGEDTTSYEDRGAPQQITLLAPESNSTQGLRLGDMAMVGSRLYGTRDKDNPYRVWVSGQNNDIGKFAMAFDSTYVDIQKGGQFKPITVRDYRDGKGEPLATIWCDSPDGTGAIWQGSLETFTVDDISFPVLGTFRLAGSRGTSAPLSVISVLNDYIYYNDRGFFNLGSRAQFLNLLSTDEVSANIRPDVRKIRASASSKIAGHFDGAKLYMSVPYNSDDNNATIVYDTAINGKPWLPRGFNVGFSKFFSYADNTSEQTKHLICFKPGDTRLSEIGEDIRGFYGEAFNSSLITGLRPINDRNRFEFMWCEEAEIEFAQPQGEIVVELSAITREEGFKRIGEPVTIKPKRLKNSWTTKKWSVSKWTDTDTPAVSYSEPSMKRYFSVNEEINAYQYRVQTSSIQSQYILRTLQIHGTSSQGGKPPEWELLDE